VSGAQRGDIGFSNSDFDLSLDGQPTFEKPGNTSNSAFTLLPLLQLRFTRSMYPFFYGPLEFLLHKNTNI
jgi:hypothetical protein